MEDFGGSAGSEVGRCEGDVMASVEKLHENFATIIDYAGSDWKKTTLIPREISEAIIIPKNYRLPQFSLDPQVFP